MLILGGAIALFLVLQYGVLPRTDAVATPLASVEAAEKRLRRLQQIAQQKPRAVAEVQVASRELAEAERGLLKAATPALALAEMQQIMKDLLSAQGIALQGSEFGAVKAAGEDYAQVPLTVAFSCSIDQWVNLMAALRNANQVLSTLDVRLGQADTKNKTLQVRMVVAGYIPASLVAASKAAGAL